ncbi:hypothetical protein [Campylobacter majalis]|uniref:hypothetical protein n=1 Tax=Campylobacter majalis TaxID=2790656 RepID=UPI003D6934BD
MKQNTIKTRRKERNFSYFEIVRKSQTYKNEATNELQKFYKLVKCEFDSGKNTFRY